MGGKKRAGFAERDRAEGPSPDSCEGRKDPTHGRPVRIRQVVSEAAQRQGWMPPLAEIPGPPPLAGRGFSPTPRATQASRLLIGEAV